MNKFKITLPKGLATAISRRHNGREDITKNQALDGCIEMQMLWVTYQKVRDKLNYVDDVWWDEKKIEEQFMQPKWYYAHRKRKKLMKEKRALHKKMFYLLVFTDGNNESFDSGSLEAEECYLQFIDNYGDKAKKI